METTTTLNECLLARNPVTRRCYVGTFPSDEIPPLGRLPAALVLNHDPAAQAGSHWVALYVSATRTAYYFDPLGDAPPDGPISDYLRQYSRVVRNRCRFQPTESMACGAFAIYMLFHLCKGEPFDRVLSRLCAAPDPNALVLRFVEFICPK